MKKDYFNEYSIKYFKKWSDKEWPHIIKSYNSKTGKLDNYASLKEINKYSNIIYKQLPFDDH